MIDLHPRVENALRSGGPVVALESTIVAHGLPRPANLDVARQIEAAVESGGATPATIAVVNGRIKVGLGDEDLRHVATSKDIAKASVRDLGPVIAAKASAATTVASTAYLSHQVGIRVFATGGLGGVHHAASETFDESADIDVLGQVPVVVVCAGVKSILDIGATLERFETRGVPVLGYRTDTFPAFYLRDSGYALSWRVETPAEVASVAAVRAGLGQSEAVVVAQSVSEDDQMDRSLHEGLLEAAMSAARASGVRGKDVTPAVLAHFHQHSGGESQRVNVALVLQNARLAAEIAAVMAPV